MMGKSQIVERKILFVHFFNSFSGSPKVLESIISVLKKNNNCVLLTNKTQGFLDGVDIPKVLFKFNLSRFSILTLINYFVAQVTTFFLVMKYLEKRDIIYVNTTIPMFAAFAARIKGAYIVFHLHEDRGSLNPVHRFLSSFRKYCCDYEIFVSEYLHSIEHKKYLNFSVIHNVLPQEFVNRAFKERLVKKKNGLFNVLMICSLKEYKGVLEFVELSRLLLNESDLQFDLLLGEDQDVIDQYFKAMVLPENLNIFAKTLDIAAHYNNASLLLNLSRPDQWVETFGLTILEGMTYGLPCIVPPVGGPVELVKNGVNGYTISSYETLEISKLIVGLFLDKDLYKRMSKNSKEISDTYTFEKFENNVNNVMKNLPYNEV